MKRIVRPTRFNSVLTALLLVVLLLGACGEPTSTPQPAPTQIVLAPSATPVPPHGHANPTDRHTCPAD